MQITHLTLYAANLAAQRMFYTQTLGLPLISASPESFSVQAGATQLAFIESAKPMIYHFAFNIPANQFAEAYAWARPRFKIQHDSNGQNIFRFSRWNAHALYFIDPAGNIGEFIARRSLANESGQPFGPHSLLNVSEIGLTTTDVRGAVNQLESQFGLGVYDGGDSDEFTAVGDEHGLFIVVRRGRFWYLSDEAPAEILPLTVELSSGARVEQTVDRLKIRAAAPAIT